MMREEFQRKILAILEDAKHSEIQMLGKGHKLAELECFRKLQRLLVEARQEAV